MSPYKLPANNWSILILGALAELQKMKHLYEKAVEQKEALARENKKLQGLQFLIDTWLYLFINLYITPKIHEIFRFLNINELNYNYYFYYKSKYLCASKKILEEFIKIGKRIVSYNKYPINEFILCLLFMC